MKVQKPKEDKEEKKGITLTIDESDLTELERESIERDESLDEFFGDKDSTEFRIYRLQPKGEGIEGFLDTHPAPFTFQDLKILYGGGYYRIVKQKAGGGRAAFLGQKLERIAGPPRLQPGGPDADSKFSAHEDLRAEIRSLKEELTRPKGNTVFTPEFVQELITAKLLLDKGNSSGGKTDADLIKLLVQSGDKKFEGLLEGIELGKRLEGGGGSEEGEDSWLKTIAETVARILQGKNLELSTVRRTEQGSDAAQVKVTPTPPNLEAQEQMIWSNLIDKVEGIIQDGIYKNTPPADVAAQLKFIASPILLNMLKLLDPKNMLALLESEYAEDQEFSALLQKEETRIYLTQILEELKK